MIVDIDEAQLDRELDALLAGLPPDPLEGDYIPVGKSWKDTLRKYRVVEQGRKMEMLASLSYPDEFNEDMTDALGGVGDHLWPGGVELADSWGPYGKLAFVLATLALMNVDKLLSMFAPPAPPQPAAPTPGPTEQPIEEGEDGQPRA